MNEERVNFGIVMRTAFSLIPLLFGLPTPAMVLCAYNISMSYMVCGPITAVASSLCTVCLSMVLCGFFGAAGQLQGLYIGLQAVLCAAACIYAVRKKSGFYTGMRLAAAAYLLPSCADLYFSAKKAGESIADFLTKQPLELMKSQLHALCAQVGTGTESVDALLSVITKFTVMIIPSVLIISSTVIGYIVMWCVCAPLRKTPMRVPHSFAMIRTPKTVVLLLAAALGAAALSDNSTVTYAAVNVAMIFSAVCFFGGMSIADYYMRRVIYSTVLRVIIHFIIYILSAALSGVTLYVNIFTVYILLGAVGAFVNLRRLPDNLYGEDAASEEESALNEREGQ